MGTLNPLEIFPVEVWKIIFEHLGGQPGSSTNLLNCSNVCTKFEEVLNPTQFQWLFESVCPFIFPFLEGKELLMCRRVCKEWCRVVNNFLKNFEARLPFNEETTDISGALGGKEYILKEKCIWTRFTKTEEISEFMEVMKHGKHPFVGGSLQLNQADKSNRTENTFNLKASELLIRLGKHVKHISLKPVILNAYIFYYMIRKYLLSLPNLRSLEVDGIIPFYEFTDFTQNCRRLRQLKELLQREPYLYIPEISSLESLTIHAYQLPRCITEKLIDDINPRKLRCLKLRLNQLPEEGNLMTLKQPLPSLTELHLDQIQSYEQFEHLLSNLVSKEAPLGKLVLHFAYSVTLSKINFDLVFEAISKFGRTLKMLTIFGFQSNDAITELPNPSWSMLKISHLRSLKMDGVAFGPRFLPSNLAQSLEYLDVSLTHKLAWETEFYEGALDGNLCYSPIWSEMPKLKVIKVHLMFNTKTITCTRVMHERGVHCPIEPLCID